MTTFLSNREIYERIVCGIVPQAKERLWIATADIKDMYVEPPSRASSFAKAPEDGTEARPGGRDMVPFLGSARVLSVNSSGGSYRHALHAEIDSPCLPFLAGLRQHG